MLNNQDRITLTLPEADAETLMAELEAKGVEAQKATALRQAGGGEFATIILPIALTAVQVAAGFVTVFLAAHLAKKVQTDDAQDAEKEREPAAPKIEIKIGRVHIAEANFTVSGVEETIGRSLSDD